MLRFVDKDQDTVTGIVSERLSMKSDGRLARMLHVLVHMGLLGGRETSERIAQMLNTNPVVVRRTLGALRNHGIVDSEGGRGGGWKLTRPLDRITVLDVQRALIEGQMLPAPLSRDHPNCPVERASNAVLKHAHRLAEAELEKAYAATTLAQIAETAVATK
jgi:DNA-binding IscR family transcriptional regulator